MTKRLLVIEGDNKGRFFLAVDGGAITIGDSPTHAEAVLRDLHIRRIHCEVEVDEDEVVVNSPPAGPGAPAHAGRPPQGLHPGEVLHLAHALVRLEPNGNEPAHAPVPKSHPSVVPAHKPAPSIVPSVGSTDILGLKDDGDMPGFIDPDAKPVAAVQAPLAPTSATASTGPVVKRLFVVDGADQGRFFLLPNAGTVTIGNSSRNVDIVLHDLYVARVHCELRVEDKQALVTQMEGATGALINGQPIGKQAVLPVSGVLRVGNSYLRLDIISEAEFAASQKSAEEAIEAVTVDDIVEAEPTVDDEEANLPLAAVDKVMGLEDQKLGHHVVGKLLGRGHCGLVFKAVDQKHNHTVALKVLSPDFPANDGELQQFVKAVKTLTTLHHPTLVKLHGVGRTGQFCWIAREFVEGESVARLIQRLVDGGKLDWMRALRIVTHLGNTLSYLHSQKIVHTNITPRNLLIHAGDKATKVTDLMLAQALKGSVLAKLIHHKKALAELPFMAPEQTEADGFVDHVADLYAVGAIAYALLTTKPPFGGESAKEIIHQVRHTKVQRPRKVYREIPLAFEYVVMKLLMKKQEERFQTADELLAELAPIIKEHEKKP